MFTRIRITPGMTLGPELRTWTYNRKRTSVYPLHINPAMPNSRWRGPHKTGRALLRAGNPEAAEPSLRAGLTELESDPAADPVWVAEAQSDLGSCLVQLGRYAEAEQALLAAYQVFRPGGKAPARVSGRQTLKHLVELYGAWNRPEQEARYRSLLEGEERAGNW
jgi:hypothetical protein